MSVVLHPCCAVRGLCDFATALLSLLLMIANASTAEAGGLDWTEMYIPYNEDMYSESFEGILGQSPYTEDDPQRQHLHIYQQPSSDNDTPSPVFFFSHSNGKTARDLLDEGDLEYIVKEGYSVISWESVTSATTVVNSQACADDFELVWSWFKANADNYGLDANHVIVGGRSRGTVCSWELAHSGKSSIKGLFMINALPDAVWIPDAKLGPGYVWDQLVDEHSPPMHLVFLPQCPKPIAQDCVPSPLPDDIHNPRNGQTIVDRYHELGIGSKIQLTDGLTNADTNPYSLFAEFAMSVAPADADATKPDSVVKAEIRQADAEAKAAEEETIAQLEAEIEAELEALPPPSGIKFFFDLIALSCLAFGVAFAYDRWYRWNRSYPNTRDYERVKVHGMDAEICLQQEMVQPGTKEKGFPTNVNW